jgi:hypothetical protein
MVLVLLSALCACNNTSTKHGYSTVSEPEQHDISYTSSIKKSGTRIMVDTNIILSNRNLKTLLANLDTAKLIEHKKANEIPSFIKTFLRKHSDDKFLIANSDETFAAGCSRFENEPFRQVQYLGFNDNYLLLTYKIGGWALFGHTIIIKFDKEEIIDFWTGGGNLNLTTKEKILEFLKTNMGKEWGLNTNIIYI